MKLSILTLLLTGVASFGGTILTNLNGNDLTGSLLSPGDVKATEFTMGSSAYSLDSFVIRLQDTSTFANGTVGAELDADSGGVPGVKVLNLNGITLSPSSPANYTFTPVNSFVLTPGTSYWLVIYSNINGAATLSNSPSILASNAAASMVANLFSFNGGATFNPGNGTSYAINATLVPTPEPSTALLSCAGLLLAAMARRGKRD